ncbi:plasma kallikrein-like [Varroa jacobsoni]|uniref:plasma kallikrein-like n=1 Tax=Varroa jacobsoni TaxID=62625 RepID=UPI000BF633FB|nr:plasma kallikrein-like [Varroa jacobsoni]
MSAIAVFIWTAYSVSAVNWEQGVFNWTKGATQVEAHEYPWKVSIQANYRPKQQAFDWGHEFMGAILNHRWVVTGGVNIVHKCVKYSRCRIIAGTTNVSVNTRHGTVINVEKVYPHYTSRPNSTGGDIALIRTLENIPIESPTIGIICLLPPTSQDDTALVGKSCFTITWGKWKTRLRDDILFKIDLKVVPHMDCTRNIPGLPRTNLCGSRTDAGKDKPAYTCTLGTGAPLVCNINGVYSLIGLSSFGGIDCMLREQPFVFVRTQDFYTWMNEAIEIHNYQEQEIELEPEDRKKRRY